MAKKRTPSQQADLQYQAKQLKLLLDDKKFQLKRPFPYRTKETRDVHIPALAYIAADDGFRAQYDAASDSYKSVLIESKSRTVRNWLKGITFIGSEEQKKRLIEYFNLPADYFERVPTLEDLAVETTLKKMKEGENLKNLVALLTEEDTAFADALKEDLVEVTDLKFVLESFKSIILVFWKFYSSYGLNYWQKIKGDCLGVEEIIDNFQSKKFKNEESRNNEIQKVRKSFDEENAQYDFVAFVHYDGNCDPHLKFMTQKVTENTGKKIFCSADDVSAEQEKE